ncbi:hypothetical protein K7X08_027710 [Anisodus acutangulus]|uniref:Uncharacterized protein n=1 Tax=Anisodus acutangulus TaxID=402998 RepID=A0A9Q1LKU3_9SOLA|nr:hypothetical protein K7X08_027710 [Anisodus acutangulus]
MTRVIMEKVTMCKKGDGNGNKAHGKNKEETNNTIENQKGKKNIQEVNQELNQNKNGQKEEQNSKEESNNQDNNQQEAEISSSNQVVLESVIEPVSADTFIINHEGIDLVIDLNGIMAIAKDGEVEMENTDDEVDQVSNAIIDQQIMDPGEEEESQRHRNDVINKEGLSPCRRGRSKFRSRNNKKKSKYKSNPSKRGKETKDLL